MVGVGENVGAVFFCDGADKNGFHAAVASEAHVAGTVTDHHRAGEVDVGIVGFGLQRQSCIGLAARASTSSQVGTYIYFIDMQSVFFQNTEQMSMNIFHGLLCTDTFGDTLLVGDNENLSEILDDEWYGLYKIVPNLQFGNVLHVVIDTQNVDYSVAVQK